MDQGWYFRLAVVLGACGLAGYMLYPSYVYHMSDDEAEIRETHEKFCEALPSWASCRRFNLGLDLQGGVHLVMGVGVDKALQNRTDRLADFLREQMQDEKLAFTKIDRPRGSSQISVTLAGDTDSGEFEKFLRREFEILEVTGRTDASYTLELIESEATYTKDQAVEQTIVAIRNRADKLGVTEPTIARRGEDNILIQLPGIKDPQRAIDLIGRTAQLEFKIVDENATGVFDGVDEATLPVGVTKLERQVERPQGAPAREVYFHLPESKAKELRAQLQPLLPSTVDLLFGPAVNEVGDIPDTLRTYVTDARAGITGDYLTEASVRQNPDLPSQFDVTMSFDTKGGKIFGDLTERNVRRYMAIVLDDKVNSAPIIEEKIGGGTARIRLNSAGNQQQNMQEARDLALVLKAGALPAPVEIREQREVGQSLGKVAIQDGRNAIAIGGILVVLFMLVYYRGSGLIANLALVVNVFFVMAVLAVFEATLTLPGMAGIVLTVGMAVDANVIIFERIREELKIGKTPRAAIESGYGKAFSTIFDANVTTLIAGVVLMEYGSGPVRGFAVTLIIGILCSMFTAIIMTRLIFDFFSARRRLQTLSI